MPPRLPPKPTPMSSSPSLTISYDPAIANVVGQVFQTDEAAFLAGYLAAGVTKTGKVGTFGGLPDPAPSPSSWMVSLVALQYYNESQGHHCEGPWLGPR